MSDIYQAKADAKTIAGLTERDPAFAAMLPKHFDGDDELREAARELADALAQMFARPHYRVADVLDVARARIRVLRALGEVR